MIGVVVFKKSIPLALQHEYLNAGIEDLNTIKFKKIRISTVFEYLSFKIKISWSCIFLIFYLDQTANFSTFSNLL